ncbi:hypothetical protein [Photobacterium galatheae]|uniref:Uncharacterized protein n=1 Tax=Photobacterium galatheae TaxID=1654360 RepID=A0A066RHQ9_9GAMM|nr:hypothetical protein [Photobacterium galatheae]KDM89854.1 hypothetical protein EA58_20605 [Photobacterium galatheae]MCM0151149.1 hypothetical protein [Photobacterium galatheae]
MTKKNLLLRFILPLMIAMILGAVVLNYYTYHTRPAELHLTSIELAPFSDDKSVLLKPELIAMSQKEYDALIAMSQKEYDALIAERSDGGDETLGGECQRWTSQLPAWLLCGDPGYLQHTDLTERFIPPSKLSVSGLLKANPMRNALYIYRISRDLQAEGSLISQLDVYTHDDGVAHYYRYDEKGTLMNQPLSDLPQPVVYVEDVINTGLQPTLRFTFSNRGAREARLNALRSERVFVVTAPSQHDYQGEHLPSRLAMPANGFNLGPDEDETVSLTEPVTLGSQQDKAVEVPLNILDLGTGTSPGYLLVRFYLDYSDGSKNQSMLLGSFLFSDHVHLVLGE